MLAMKITPTKTQLCLTFLSMVLLGELCFAQSAVTPLPMETNWAQFHFAPRHGGFNLYETVLSPTTVGNLGLLWKYGTGSKVLSSPAVVDGVVYAGSLDFNVYALNASTGARLWQFTAGDGVDSSPAVANGVVYVGSLDNNIYALNASTGAVLWQFFTGYAIYTAPTVADGVVYIGSESNVVYALNASTGAELWEFNTGFSEVDPRPLPTAWFTSVRTTLFLMARFLPSTPAQAQSFGNSTLGRMKALPRRWLTVWFTSARDNATMFTL
jgi:hypothetical protein